VTVEVMKAKMLPTKLVEVKVEVHLVVPSAVQTHEQSIVNGF
jgi:hypothetical protein